MKKSIIALMSIFALVSCSEDSYEAKDNSTPNPSFENTVKTVQSSLGINGYYSPYDGNMGIQVPYRMPFEFDIQAPVSAVQITPHVGYAYKNLHLAQQVNPSNWPNFQQYAPDVNAIEVSVPFTLTPGLTVIKDCSAAIPLSMGCPQVPFPFSFNAVGNEYTLLAENSKIYYIDYKFDLGGQTFSGSLKHQLGDDTMRLNDYTSNSWTYVSDFPKLNSSPYDEVVVVSSNATGEMALAQRNTTTNPLNSEVTVTDPGTGIDYTLRFRNELNRIVIEFKP